jgi:glycerol uptake facilitator-like aquaporin
MTTQTLRGLSFGWLANAGALASILMCYGKVVLIAALSLAGIAVANINPHLQAALMVGFALVAVAGLALDYRFHRDYAPLVFGVTGTAVLAGTLYISFYADR